MYDCTDKNKDSSSSSVPWHTRMMDGHRPLLGAISEYLVFVLCGVTLALVGFSWLLFSRLSKNNQRQSQLVGEITLIGRSAKRNQSEKQVMENFFSLSLWYPWLNPLSPSIWLSPLSDAGLLCLGLEGTLVVCLYMSECTQRTIMKRDKIQYKYVDCLLLKHHINKINDDKIL